MPGLRKTSKTMNDRENYVQIEVAVKVTYVDEDFVDDDKEVFMES